MPRLANWTVVLTVTGIVTVPGMAGVSVKVCGAGVALLVLPEVGVAALVGVPEVVEVAALVEGAGALVGAAGVTVIVGDTVRGSVVVPV